MYPFCFTFPFVAVIGVLVPIGAIAARSFAFLGASRASAPGASRAVAARWRCGGARASGF